MKIAFRNFLTTLRRYKISSLLNVIGLTLAFTAFYVIMTQVWWELGYNRSLHEAGGGRSRGLHVGRFRLRNLLDEQRAFVRV